MFTVMLRGWRNAATTDFPNFTSYKAKTFYRINDLLDDISKDERVDIVELDLIDPSIRPN